MRDYELTLIIDPQLADKDQKGLAENLKKWLEAGKAGSPRGEAGKVVKEEIWGRKRLAYPIKKQDEGIYFFYGLRSDGQSLVEVEKKLKLEEKILRYLLVRKDPPSSD